MPSRHLEAAPLAKASVMVGFLYGAGAEDLILVTSCYPSIPPEEFLGPSGPKLETELKVSSRGLAAPGSKKLKSESKKSQEVEKELKLPLFDSFSTLILTFWTPEGRKRELMFNSISNFRPEGPFPTFGPKRPRTPHGRLKDKRLRKNLSPGKKTRNSG